MNARLNGVAGFDFRRLSDRAAHDLKAPLRNIGLLVDMLPDAPEQLDPQELAVAKRRILTCVEMGRSVVAGLERLTHASFAEWTPQPVDIWDLIDAAAEDAFASFAQPIIDRVADGSPRCLVDPDAMRLVLVELFDNAVRHSGAQELRLKIAVESDAAGLAVSVSDNGRAPADEVRDRLFEPFCRLSQPADGSRRAGVGLSVCRAIIERHGGEIAFESVDGVASGARVRIVLPHDVVRIEAAEAVRAASPTAPSPPDVEAASQ